MKQNSDTSQHLCLVLAPKEGTCKIFSEISRRYGLYRDVLKSWFLSVPTEFSGTGVRISSIQQFPSSFHRGVFSYSSLYLHHKYPVGVSQCIHSDILKMETKMRECQGTCHGMFLFIMLMLWNQKRAARLHHCWLCALGKHFFRIEKSLWISVLLNEEEFILFLLLWVSMNFDYTSNPFFLISWWFSDVSLVLLPCLALVAAVHFLTGGKSVELPSDYSIYFKTAV